MAALQITNLYKTGLGNTRAAFQDGYAQALRDTLECVRGLAHSNGTDASRIATLDASICRRLDALRNEEEEHGEGDGAPQQAAASPVRPARGAGPRVTPAPASPASPASRSDAAGAGRPDMAPGARAGTAKGLPAAERGAAAYRDTHVPRPRLQHAGGAACAGGGDMLVASMPLPPAAQAGAPQALKNAAAKDAGAPGRQRAVLQRSGHVSDDSDTPSGTDSDDGEGPLSGSINASGERPRKRRRARGGDP